MWLIDLLFGAKNFKFSELSGPLADLPDNAMSLVSCPLPDYEQAPEKISHFEFGPACGEDNPMSVELSREIICALCNDKQCLTVIRAHMATEKREYLPAESIDWYTKELQNTGSTTSLYRVDERTLAYLTAGYDKEVFSTYYASRPGVLWDFYFYTFSPDAQLPSAKHAWNQATSHQYAVRMDYADYGATTLALYVNPEAGDVTYLQQVIKQICDEKNIKLGRFSV